MFCFGKSHLQYFFFLSIIVFYGGISIFGAVSLWCLQKKYLNSVWGPPFHWYNVIYPAVKYWTLFCEHLVDCNGARLHEATLKLHTQAWIFSRLSIASVDGKLHLSEVGFSALVWFSLTTRTWFPGRTRTPRTYHQWLWCPWRRGHCLWSPLCPMRSQYEVAFALLQSFRHFPYNENLTRALNTTPIKCSLPSTNAIDRRE